VVKEGPSLFRVSVCTKAYFRIKISALAEITFYFYFIFSGPHEKSSVQSVLGSSQVLLRIISTPVSICKAGSVSVD